MTIFLGIKLNPAQLRRVLLSSIKLIYQIPDGNYPQGRYAQYVKNRRVLVSCRVNCQYACPSVCRIYRDCSLHGGTYLVFVHDLVAVDRAAQLPSSQNGPRAEFGICLNTAINQHANIGTGGADVHECQESCHNARNFTCGSFEMTRQTTCNPASVFWFSSTVSESERRIKTR